MWVVVVETVPNLKTEMQTDLMMAGGGEGEGGER